ncbi:MAG TPA: hypothetical protein VFQ45_22875 [Longimicrobium sp.]|nr:hypothetical protein [Longimicrobium sp.]
MTPRAAAVLAAALLAACGSPAPPSAAPPPAAPPPAPSPVPPLPPPGTQPVEREIEVCVLENGELRGVMVRYNPLTGDTTPSGRPVPPGYAQDAAWYITGDPIPVHGVRYAKYGLPRVVRREELVRYGEYRGIALFADAGATGRPEILYVPVRPGCEFQPYVGAPFIGAVRG